MSRGPVILLFWVIGFAIGFAGYLVVPDIAEWLGQAMPRLYRSQDCRCTGSWNSWFSRKYFDNR